MSLSPMDIHRLGQLKRHNARSNTEMELDAFSDRSM